MTDETSGVETRVEYIEVEQIMLWPTTFNTVLKREMEPGRFFKKLAIGAGIGFGVLFAVCGITRRCQN